MNKSNKTLLKRVLLNQKKDLRRTSENFDEKNKIFGFSEPYLPASRLDEGNNKSNKKNRDLDEVSVFFQKLEKIS